MMGSSRNVSSGSREILSRGATACAPNIFCGLRLRMVGRPASGREGTLISTRAIKAARAWVAQLGQRRSVEVAVPQGFAGSNPAPRIFDWAQRIGAAVTIQFDLPTPESLTDEPTTRIRHQDREGDDRGLERPGSRVGQGLGN